MWVHYLRESRSRKRKLALKERENSPRLVKSCLWREKDLVREIRKHDPEALSSKTEFVLSYLTRTHSYQLRWSTNTKQWEGKNNSKRVMWNNARVFFLPFFSNLHVRYLFTYIWSETQSFISSLLHDWRHPLPPETRIPPWIVSPIWGTLCSKALPLIWTVENLREPWPWSFPNKDSCFFLKKQCWYFKSRYKIASGHNYCFF